MRSPIHDCTALITGGAGFIGSHLADRLYEEGARQVIVIDNMFLGRAQNLSQALDRGAVLYRDDAEFATSLEAVFAAHPIDIVFNCATKALVHSFTNPANAFLVNPHVAINLLELLRQERFGTLVHFSTSEVYGSAVYEPMDEAHPMHPTTAYAAGKAAADLAVTTYVDQFNVDAFIVRPFNNYGPRQNDTGPMAAVIPRTVRRLQAGERPELHGTGEQSRDFIYVHDTVDAVVKVHDKMEAGAAVNISTDNQITIRDLLARICHLMDEPFEPDIRPARQNDVECHNASNQKLSRMIDYRLTSIDEGLEATVAWYQDHR